MEKGEEAEEVRTSSLLSRPSSLLIELKESVLLEYCREACMNIQDNATLESIGAEKRLASYEHDTWHNAGSVRCKQLDVRTAEELKS